MANEWSILSPIAATNLVTNPSFELVLTGWTAYTGDAGTLTATRVSTNQRFGVYSAYLEYVYNSNAGQYYNTDMPATAGLSYTASAFIYCPASPGNATYKISIDWYTAASGYISSTLGTESQEYGYWKRFTVTGTAPATTAKAGINIRIATASVNLYVDAIQFEQSSYATSYLDGSLAGYAGGYAWTGAPHTSTSTRSSNERSGGRAYTIGASLGSKVKVNTFDGAGMPALNLNSDDYALLPGAIFRNTKVTARTMTLVISLSGSATVEAYHSLRKDLIDLVKPDLTTPEQPFTLLYSGANDETDALEMACHYIGGLEINSPTHPTLGRLGLQLMAMNPYWYETGNDAISLDTNDTATARYMAMRNAATGQWSNAGLTANPSTNGEIFAIAVNPTNPDIVIFGGDFVGWNGIAGANYIVKYTISTATWALVGAGSTIDRPVYAMAYRPDGTLFIGGEFINVVDANGDYLVKYDGTNITSVLVGGTGTIYTLAFDQDGVLWIGGNFDNWGDANGDNLVKLSADLSAYSSVATGRDGDVNSILVDANNRVWIGGDFTNELCYSDDGSTLTDAGTGTTAGGIDGMAMLPDGRLAVVGNFAGAQNLSAPEGLVLYNGSAFTMIEGGALAGQISGGAGADVYTVVWSNSHKKLFIGGEFTGAVGGLQVDGLLAWNGSAFERMFINLAANIDINAIAVSGKNIFIGTDATAAAYWGGSTTVTNSGTATAYPIFRFKRSGGTSAEIQQIYNHTTGDEIQMRHFLLDGETLTVSCVPGDTYIKSDIVGPIYSGLANTSSLNFRLQPGANTIICFVDAVGSPTVTATVEWKIPHWSVDGIAP